MNKKDRAQLAKAHELIGDAEAIVDAVATVRMVTAELRALRETKLDLQSAKTRIRKLMFPDSEL